MGKKDKKKKKKTGASGKGHRSAGGETKADVQGHEDVNEHADQGQGCKNEEASRADVTEQEQRSGYEPEAEGACAMIPETSDGTNTSPLEEGASAIDLGPRTRQVVKSAKGTRVQYVQNIKAGCIQVGDHNVMELGVPHSDGSPTEDTDPEQEDDKAVSVASISPRPSASYAEIVKREHKQYIKGKVVNVTNFVQIQSAEPVTKEPKPLDSSMKYFLEAVGEFTDGHYILIAGKTSHIKYLEAISLVPWIAVFDFDPESRTKGLLSYVEEKLRKRRSIHLLSWQDKCAINETSTSWIFAKGHVESADSRVDETFKSWKSRTKECINQQIQQIQKFRDGYTCITAVVLWPDDSSLTQHIHHILNEIAEFSPNIVIAENCPEDKDIDVICTSLLSLQEIKVKRINISIEQVCKAMYYFLEVSDEVTDGEYKLPSGDGTQDAGITHEKAKYLQEDLEVLYVDNRTGIEYKLDTIKQEEDTFLKGGTLPWAFWYGTGPGHIDIERDIHRLIKLRITTKHIEVVRSGFITLYHAPGSGGTTLAQRILWELHTQTPCVQVKHNTASSPQDIAEKIEFLSDRTRLPILVLLDGEEEQKVARIERLLRDTSVVILYVKRHTTGFKKVTKNTFTLSQYVSPREANCLGSKYISQVNEERKRISIRKLVEEVSNGQDKTIFDFGLAVHSYEYKGIEPYVRSFLKLEDVSSQLPWQKALGFLSLAHYYGHTGVPCHFFSQMLSSQNHQHVLTFADFPDEMQEFIVRNHHEGRSHVARISHYLVAKEILDQLLCPKQRERKAAPTIHLETKRNIAPLAIKFIKYSEEVAKDESASSLSKINTNIFITRDNRRVGENEPEVTNTKKRRFSQILEDVSSEAPYTERFDIVNQLVDSFPLDPLLRSHLGRLYVICRPEMESNAEGCFKEALKLCHLNMEGCTKAAIPFNMKLTLSHVHHMFGNMYLRRAQSKCKQLSNTIDDDQFHTYAADLLEMVGKACENFGKCRQNTPEGMEESYGYIGEIEARLLFCQFINTHREDNVLDYAQKAVEARCELERRIGKFIEDTFVSVDQLFIECFSVIEPGKMNFPVRNSQALYACLFNTNNPGHMHFHSGSTTARRFQVAIRKGKYHNKKSPYVGLELVNKKDDVLFIVRKYEENIDEAFRDENLFLSSRREFDIDFREWLYAIRNKNISDRYSIEEVLKKVQRWYDTLKTPFSRFYLFALKSILGFGSDSGVNNELLLQAQSLKEEMIKYSKFMTKPRYPHEWLGSDITGVRRLAPGSRFFGRCAVLREKSPESRILKGTIAHPNDKPAAGFIEIDLAANNLVPVRAFYVPIRCDMKGKSFAGTRVEFSLAFTMSHGFDAFNVIPLKKLKCEQCGNSNVEIRSCDNQTHCHRCQNLVRRNTRLSKK